MGNVENKEEQKPKVKLYEEPMNDGERWKIKSIPYEGS